MLGYLYEISTNNYSEKIEFIKLFLKTLNIMIKSVYGKDDI